MWIGSVASVHKPVLLEEVLAQLGTDTSENVRVIFDGTLGGGGHSEALLERFPEAVLVGTDRDAAAVARTAERLSRFSKRCFFVTASFDEIDTVWSRLPAELRRTDAPHFDRMLLDLGISSDQLDDPDRGFTFHGDGPLDMRMDTSHGKTAADILNGASESELKRIFLRGGMHRLHAASLVREVSQRRPITSRKEFAALCEQTAPAAEKFRTSGRRRNPATLPFQSLRLEVNDELGVLQRFLSAAPEHLAPGARLAIISFHSLEDKYVTQAMRRWSKPTEGDARRPGAPFGKLLTKSAIVPSEKESALNPRARSARMRVFERARGVS